MKKVNIVLVEDEVLIRQGIKSILEQEDHFNVIEEFGDGNSFVNYIDSCDNLPDIVLTDIKMPGLNGVEATKQLCIKFPDLKIIALSSFNSEVFISNMLEAGAVCYIPKSASMEVMIDNINKVVINGFYYDDSIMNYVFDHTSKTRSVLDEDFLARQIYLKQEQGLSRTLRKIQNQQIEERGLEFLLSIADKVSNLDETELREIYENKEKFFQEFRDSEDFVLNTKKLKAAEQAYLNT